MSLPLVVICGVPKAGKTTLASSMGRPTFHTDDHIALGRDGQIGYAAMVLGQGEYEVFEGVYMAHALRKRLADHEGKPCERVVWMPGSRVPYVLKGQASMAKGVTTVWRQIVEELRRRGVEIGVEF